MIPHGRQYSPLTGIRDDRAVVHGMHHDIVWLVLQRLDPVEPTHELLDLPRGNSDVSLGLLGGLGLQSTLRIRVPLTLFEYLLLPFRNSARAVRIDSVSQSQLSIVLPLQEESIHGERKANVARGIDALREQILERGDIERGSEFT